MEKLAVLIYSYGSDCMTGSNGKWYTEQFLDSAMVMGRLGILTAKLMGLSLALAALNVSWVFNLSLICKRSAR